jgi:hypothetical protein
MPLVWVRGTDGERTRTVLRAIPTVESATVLEAFGDEWLYEMERVDHIELLLRMVTNGEATVLDAYGRGDRWTLRVMYPTRDDLTDTHEFCTDYGLSLDIESFRELDGEPAGSD